MDRNKPIDFNTLIPEMKDWNNGQGISVWSWIGCMGSYELAIGYCSLFWPRFVVHENMVFREECNLTYLAGCLENCKGDRSAVEAVLNHLHLTDLHHHLHERATAEQLEYLGNTLREIYKCKLSADFPDREFIVQFTTDDVNDLDDYRLTFYQKSPA